MTKSKKHIIITNILVVGCAVGIVIGVFVWGLSYTNALNEKKSHASNFTLNLPDFNKYNNTVDSNTVVKTNALGDGAIISRPIKGLGGYKHYGVMCKGRVLHYNQYNLYNSTLEEFSENIPIKVVKPGLYGKELQAFYKRKNRIINKYVDSKYDAVNNNCEHFVNELVYNTKKSMQSDITKEMLTAYDTVIQNELIKNNMQLLVPAYNQFVRKLIIKEEVK